MSTPSSAIPEAASTPCSSKTSDRISEPFNSIKTSSLSRFSERVKNKSFACAQKAEGKAETLWYHFCWLHGSPLASGNPRKSPVTEGTRLRLLGRGLSGSDSWVTKRQGARPVCSIPGSLNKAFCIFLSQSQSFEKNYNHARVICQVKFTHRAETSTFYSKNPNNTQKSGLPVTGVTGAGRLMILWDHC